MITFIYNNNIHANINKISQELLIKYITNLRNVFKNKILKEKTPLIVRIDIETSHMSVLNKTTK